VDFPVFAKVAIGAEPFSTLVQAEPAGPVAWNFEKFLIGKDGSVVGRFKSAVEPESAELKAAIEAALAA
jgi:glutathione peroxidase